jgi:hypothetical protein
MCPRAKCECIKHVSVYLATYRYIKEETKGQIFIHYNALREILRRRFHKFPKALHYQIIKDMEYMGLIKRTGSLNGKNIIFELTGKDKDKLIYRFLNVVV